MRAYVFGKVILEEYESTAYPGVWNYTLLDQLAKGIGATVQIGCSGFEVKRIAHGGILTRNASNNSPAIISAQQYAEVSVLDGDGADDRQDGLFEAGRGSP